MSYFWLLSLHGALRWLILLVGVFAIFRAWRGSKRDLWTGFDEKLGLVFISLLDIQLFLGVSLYAVSPLRISAYESPVYALDNQMGSFAFFHPALMVAAVIIAHTGKVLAKGVKTPAKKHARHLSCFLAALLLMILTIPWWRPFLRF